MTTPIPAVTPATSVEAVISVTPATSVEAVSAAAAVSGVAGVISVEAVTSAADRGLIACFGPAVGAAILAAGPRLAKRYVTHII